MNNPDLAFADGPTNQNHNDLGTIGPSFHDGAQDGEEDEEAAAAAAAAAAEPTGNDTGRKKGQPPNAAPALANEAAAMALRDVSEGLDRALGSLRSSAERLLGGTASFLETLGSVEKAYGKAKDLECAESQRLDAVEPAVLYRSGLLLGGDAG